MMSTHSLDGKERELLAFMREKGYPVHHKSNLFLRDVQYGVRDFFRAKYGIDIGTRKSDALAEEVITKLEAEGRLQRLSDTTWLLDMEDFQEEPKRNSTGGGS
ncbi:MAG: hypothetical protein QHI48_03495 [Bacteroidota bacterium]|nr:hypothetical protein [Bacteroidota bacterium]